MDFLYSIMGFILGIGLLIIVHELGHFGAARCFNVPVLRFSVGFGPFKRIWCDKLGTEYVISAIPLGGYVDLSNIINQKSPWIRMLIFLAGPLSSILFAIILYWLAYIINLDLNLDLNLNSLYKAVLKTYNYTKLSGSMLLELITGHVSLKHMSGPIAIGYYAGQSIKHGLDHFLNFLGIISINLGVLNLLPLPWLDGGSITHCIYEILTGRQASPKTIILGRVLGLIFLLSLTVMVLVNDLARF